MGERTLRIDDKTVVISDNPNLEAVTPETELHPFWDDDFLNRLETKGSKIRREQGNIPIPKETLFLTCGHLPFNERSLCGKESQGTSAASLRKSLIVLYLQNKQIRVRILPEPKNKNDFEGLKQICRSLNIPIRETPWEKPPGIYINYGVMDRAQQLIPSQLDTEPWRNTMKRLLKAGNITEIRTVPDKKAELITEAVFACYEFQKENVKKDSFSAWSLSQRKWRRKMNEDVFDTISTVFPVRFTKNTDTNAEYDTITVPYGIKPAETFPCKNRSEYIRRHKKDYIYAGWAGVETAFKKSENRERELPLSALKPSFLRFSVQSDLMEIDFKVKS